MRRLVLVSLLPAVASAQPLDPPAPGPAPESPAAAAPAPAPAVTPTPAAPVEPTASRPASVATAPAPELAADPWAMRVAGFIQGQYRTRENSTAPFDEDGFRLARVRLQARGAGTIGKLAVTSLFEGELAPTFVLFDAQVTLAYPLDDKGGVVQLDLGQMRMPISRQQMLSDAKLSFVDKQHVATIAPDRDLGGYFTFVPKGVPQLRVMGGAFNGETKNQIQNINESYFYAGRVEVTPFGGPAPLTESNHENKTWASLGISLGRNKLTPGMFHERRLYFGADISGAWRDLSGSVEYLEVRYRFDGETENLPGPAYKANGFGAQVAYLLPVTLPPAGKSRLELAARIEEIDRNDTVPIPQLADPNQSFRQYTGVVSWYLREHTLKAQLAFSRFQELETLTSTRVNATYDNDQVLLQVTYRVD